MPTIVFTSDSLSADCEEGDWLYDVAQEAGASIVFKCKAGACGNCATEILTGRENLGAVKDREIRTLSKRGIDPKTHRLLCMCEAHGDAIIGAQAPQSEGG